MSYAIIQWVSKDGRFLAYNDPEAQKEIREAINKWKSPDYNALLAAAMKDKPKND